jgi:hypothetical protein
MDKILDDQYEQDNNGGGSSSGRDMHKSSSKLDDKMKQLIEEGLIRKFLRGMSNISRWLGRVK